MQDSAHLECQQCSAVALSQRPLDAAPPKGPVIQRLQPKERQQPVHVSDPVLKWRACHCPTPLCLERSAGLKNARSVQEKQVKVAAGEGAAERLSLPSGSAF
jgi:hypothetical protein